MGKASSSKKVARAAGTGGGRTSGGRTPWAFFSIVALIVILGVAGTVASKQHRDSKINSNGSTQSPAVGSTSVAAFAVDLCGTLAPNINTTKDPVGITTKGDGLIHIQPTKKSAAGKNATLRLFAQSIGMKLTGAELQIPGGKLYQDGNSCNGQPGHVYIRRFTSPTDTIGTPDKSDPGSIHLDPGVMFTIAFVPAAQESTIPPPPAPVRTALTQALQAEQAAASSGAGSTPTASTPTASTPGTSTPGTSTPGTSAPATTAPATTAPATSATTKP